MVAFASRSSLRDSRNGQVLTAPIEPKPPWPFRRQMFISRLLPNSLKPQRLSSADSPRLLRRYRYVRDGIALSVIEADNVKVAVRISAQTGSSFCGSHSAYWWFSAGPERQEAQNKPQRGLHLFHHQPVTPDVRLALAVGCRNVGLVSFRSDFLIRIRRNESPLHERTLRRRGGGDR
jgi:hypothetical protein